MAEPPLRLLMTADAVGGVWQYATELAAGLTHHGVETLLAVLGPAPDPAQRTAAEGVPGVTLIATGLPLDWLGDASSTRHAAAQVAAIARREGVDIVHLNSPALAADQAFPVPVLGAAHGCLSTWWQAARPGEPMDPALRWHEDMMARALRACDRVIAPSASYADLLRRHYRLQAAPRAVHNGRTPPPAIGAAPPHDCVLTAGRLWDEVKNTRTLDEAAALLPFPFHAAGSATAPHGATAETRHLHLLGQLDAASLAGRLARRPVFVSAAIFEPFGLAVLEAAAWGCPLVLSDIPTFRELWDGAAIFVPPHDAKGFAAAITESVEDLHLRGTLGEAARQRALRYSAERMASRTAAQYRELLVARLPDREARVEQFFLAPAAELPRRRFLIGGNGWQTKDMPANVRAIGHVGTAQHNAFNCTPRAVLNVARDSMARIGFSPATRVFEAAGAAACLITDAWEGIEQFLKPNEEVLVARDGRDVAEHLAALTEERAQAIGQAALARVLREHTYELRGAEVDAVLRTARAKAREAA